MTGLQRVTILTERMCTITTVSTRISMALSFISWNPANETKPECVFVTQRCSWGLRVAKLCGETLNLVRPEWLEAAKRAHLVSQANPDVRNQAPLPVGSLITLPEGWYEGPVLSDPVEINGEQVQLSKQWINPPSATGRKGTKALSAAEIDALYAKLQAEKTPA